MKTKSDKIPARYPQYITEARLLLKKAEAALMRAGKAQMHHYKRNHTLGKSAKYVSKAVILAVSGFLNQIIPSQGKKHSEHIFYCKWLLKKYTLNSDNIIHKLDLIESDFSDGVQFQEYIHTSAVHEGFKLARQVIDIIEHSAIFGRPLKLKKLKDMETINITVKIDKENYQILVKKGLNEGKNVRQYITDTVLETISSELRNLKPRKKISFKNFKK